MKIVLIILCVILIALILKSCLPKNDNKEFKDTSRQNISEQKKLIQNDKIIIVDGARYEDIKKATLQFCNIYNKQNLVAIVKLTKISENLSVLTFPYDIDFGTLCFLTNYLYYPNEIFYKADIKAWTTTRPNDDFISNENENQYSMLFIPNDDKEYDNVYMTTKENKGYKLGFAIGKSKNLFFPKLNFIENKYRIKDIEDKPNEEIK